MSCRDGGSPGPERRRGRRRHRRDVPGGAQALQPEQYRQLGLLVDDLVRLPGHQAREREAALALGFTGEDVRDDRQCARPRGAVPPARADSQRNRRFARSDCSRFRFSWVAPGRASSRSAPGTPVSMRAASAGPFLLRLALVAPLTDDAGEHVVAQLDALRSVPSSIRTRREWMSRSSSSSVTLGRHGVVAGVAVAETLLGDELVLDELGDPDGQVVDARRVVVGEDVALRALDQLLVEPLLRRGVFAPRSAHGRTGSAARAPRQERRMRPTAPSPSASASPTRARSSPAMNRTTCCACWR